MAERWEWVEIIEPNTKEHMYANLTTGECVWDPPPGVKIKKTDDNQWWELFDQNTSRFYYYNATSQKTVWHRPLNCDIIPLAKLQTLKQNTEVPLDDGDRKVKREISTQTPSAQPKREHSRTASLRSHHSNSSSTQTSPRHPRKHHHHHHKHHHHHHHHQRQDSAPQPSRHDRDKVDPYLNGEESSSETRSHRRRGSHSSQTSFTYARQEPIEVYQRSLESPTAQRHFDRRQGSVRETGSVGRHYHYPEVYTHQMGPVSPHHRCEGYSHDDYIVGLHSPEVAAVRYTQNMPDVSQITAVQVTPRPKPRSFPRTNPAYVGVHRRDGQQSYKRINIDQQLPPGLALEQRLLGDLHLRDPFITQHSHSVQTSHLGDLRHDRSDSDTSHSSYGRLRNEMTDSTISRGSQGSTAVVTKLQREHSDSHSSQGSLKNLQNCHSSQGSLRGGASDKELLPDSSQDRQDATSVSSHGSGHSNVSKHRTDPVMDTVHENTGSVDSGVVKTMQRRNSEPDYANLPMIAHVEGGKIMTIEQQLNPSNSRDTQAYPGEEHLTDDVPSGDSLSPHDFVNRQDTPSSMRSVTTQNSSHTSEGGEIIWFPDQGYDESEDSSVFSTPSPKTKSRNSQPTLPMETQHASLKRKKVPEKQETARTPTLEKSQSLLAELAQQRPLSLVLASQSEANVIVNPNMGSLQRQTWSAPVSSAPPGTLTAMPWLRHKPLSDSTIENYAREHFSCHRQGLFRKKVSLDIMMVHSQTEISYAQENLNRHKKGLLGKSVPITNMLEWTKDQIQKPMIRTNDKMVKKEAPEIFRLIQMYMGDRKSKQSLPQLALEIVSRGWSYAPLRDEVYIQLCRQTTLNRKEDSLMRGWELMGICLAFFAPSMKFHNYLEGYIYRHLDPACDTEKVPVSHFASHSQRRLEKICQSGVKKGVKKPTLDEVEQAKKSIFHPSMFGSTLEDIMLLQKEKFPDRQLPWVQTTLSEEVLRLNGAQTEGIFRVPGDIDEVNALKLQFDQWIPPTESPDPYVPASLLKLWYRELYEPLIPPEYYDQCVNNYANSDAAVEIVHSLPAINRLVLSYLIRFLQVFAAQDNVQITKMDVNNLAMVMAPNCLRCESEDPKIIFENTRKEMAFIRTLIQSLDTSFMEGII